MEARFIKAQYLMTAFFCSLLSFEGVAQNSVTLNVNLYPIQTLLVNPSQKDVNLNYVTKEDYSNGVVAEQSDHLTIYSTGGFQIRVNNSEPLEKKLPANSVTIIPSAGSKPIAQNRVAYLEKSLSEQEQPIITSTTGGINKSFNISYKGAGSNTYIDYYNSSDAITTYTYNIMYTIVSQ